MKPLHVMVAEALGWTQIGHGNSMNIADPGVGYPPTTPIVGHKEPIPRYDTDWSAAGPLIEKYEIHLHTGWHACLDLGCEAGEFEHGPVGSGETPMLAVCDLILALAAANKLPQVDA